MILVSKKNELKSQFNKCNFRYVLFYKPPMHRLKMHHKEEMRWYLSKEIHFMQHYCGRNPQWTTESVMKWAVKCMESATDFLPMTFTTASGTETVMEIPLPPLLSQYSPSTASDFKVWAPAFWQSHPSTADMMLFSSFQMLIKLPLEENGRCWNRRLCA